MVSKKYNPWKLSKEWTKCTVFRIWWDSKEKGKYYVGIGGFKGPDGKWWSRWSFGENYTNKADALKMAKKLNNMLINLQVHGAIKGRDSDD